MKFIYRLWLRMVRKYEQKKSYRVFVLLLSFISSLCGLNADDASLDPTLHGTGAIPLSDEQVQHIQMTWPRILAVRPNKIGAARIESYRMERGLPVMSVEPVAFGEDEFITNKNTDLDSFLEFESRIAQIGLPSAVDNSTLPCFPPIGDQGSSGSCVGWASTYYHATHEYGFLNSINNKTSSRGIRSPKWAYNMLNFGQDAGAYPQDAYLLLSMNGAVGVNDFPYDLNYREWDLKTQDWISALSYRMAPAFFLNVDVPTDINAIKELLNNGHIVTFVTYAYSWQMTKVKAAPSQDNPYAGQNAISWQQGASGGHHVTLVGYDDNVWIDVNNNGQVDSGEKGAFLVANSWGKNWGNNGFVWVSYDAFFRNSTVVNGPSNNRQKIAQMLFSAIPKSPNYTPKAVAKFSLSQATRNQLNLALGVSNTNAMVPSRTVPSGALSADGGAYGFDGRVPGIQTATFALDLTDLLPATSALQRYYLITQDLALGNPTTLNSYSIVDLVNNREVPYTGSPLTFDKSTLQPYIDFQLSDNNIDNMPPTVDITFPTSMLTLEDTVSITVNAQDNVGVSKVEFYVDSALFGVDSSAPYVFPLDTRTLTNGQHTIGAVAYDTAGNRSQDQVTVVVQNSTVDNIPPVVRIQSPMNGSTVSSSVTFSATASDNVGVNQLEFYVDSILQKTVSNPPYTTSIDTKQLLNGQHNFKVIAYDTSNNSAQQSVMVNVQNQGGGGTPPNVAITYPRNNTYVAGTIFVNVSATDDVRIARVELYLDCKIWNVDFSAPYTFTMDTAKISQGQHALTAIAYDDEGNFSQSTIVINVQN